jgi:hypothetical protein
VIRLQHAELEQGHQGPLHGPDAALDVGR